MRNLSLSSFVAQSNIPEKLIRSVVRQIGGYSTFKEYAQDICNHGAQGGFCGFTYYSDTISFAKRNKIEILEFCKQFDSELENVGLFAFIASFNCLRNYSQEEIAEALYTKNAGSETQVFNALAWFALEEVSRSYCDLTGNY